MPRSAPPPESLEVRLQKALKNAQTMQYGPDIRSCYGIAYIYEEMGNLVKAEEWFRKALVSRLTNNNYDREFVGEVKIYLAKVLAKRKKLAEALVFLNEAKSFKDSSVFGKIECAYGEVYLLAGDTKKALEHLRIACDQGSNMATLKLAEIYVSQKDLVNGKPILEKLVAKKVIFGMYHLGMLLLNEGNLEAAKQQFIIISQQDIVNVGRMDHKHVSYCWSEALYELAEIYIKESNYLEAIKYLEQIVDGKRRLQAKYKIAICYKHVEPEPTKFLTILQDMVDNYDYPDAVSELITYWTNNGNEGKVYALCLHTSQKNNVSAQRFLGQFYFNRSEYKKAKLHLQIGCDSSDRDSMLLMVKCDLAEGSIYHAKEVLSKFSKTFQDPDSLYEIATLYMLVKDESQAKIYFNGVVNSPEFNVDKQSDAAYQLACIVKSSNPDKYSQMHGENSYEKYLLQSINFKNDPKIKIKLGELYFIQQRFNAALRIFKEVRAVQDDNIVIYNLGVTYLALSHIDAAITLLEVCANDNFKDARYQIAKSYIRQGNFLLARGWLCKAEQTTETLDTLAYVHIKLGEYNAAKSSVVGRSPNAALISLAVNLAQGKIDDAIMTLAKMPSKQSTQKLNAELPIVNEIEKFLNIDQKLKAELVYALFMWATTNDFISLKDLCVQRSLVLCDRSMFELFVCLYKPQSWDLKSRNDVAWKLLRLHVDYNLPIYINYKSFKDNLAASDINLVDVIPFEKQDTSDDTDKLALKLLLRSGITIDERSERNYVTLQAKLLISKLKNNCTVEELRDLLATGLCHANQCESTNGNSMLQLAIWADDNDLVEECLKQDDINLQITNNFGFTAIDEAMRMKKQRAVHLLLEYMERKNISFDKSMVSSKTLEFAIKFGYARVAIAVMPFFGEEHHKMLDLAISAHINEVVDEFVNKYNCKINAKRLVDALRSANFYVFDTYFSQCDFTHDTIDLLLDAVIESKNVELVKRLVTSGQHLNINGNLEMTPLFQATRINCPAIVSYLVTVAGININKPVTNTAFTNATPLWIAASEGREDIVKILLQQPGILTNIAGSIKTSYTNDVFETPEQVAKRYGHITIEQMIKLAQQADNHVEVESVTTFNEVTLDDDEMTSVVGDESMQRDELVQRLIRENQFLRQQLEVLQLQSAPASSSDMQWNYGLHRTESMNTFSTLRTDVTTMPKPASGSAPNAKP